MNPGSLDGMHSWVLYTVIFPLLSARIQVLSTGMIPAIDRTNPGPLDGYTPRSLDGYSSGSLDPWVAGFSATGCQGGLHTLLRPCFETCFNSLV